MIRIHWTSSAAKDLASLIAYLDTESLDIGDHALAQIRKAITKLLKFPEIGRIVPEFKELGISTYRELIVSRYRVVYLLRDKNIFVYALLDQSQNVEQILINRLFRDQV